MTLTFHNARKVVTNTGAVSSITHNFKAEAADTVHVYAGEPGTHEMVQGFDYTVSGLNTDTLTVNILHPTAWSAYSKFAVYVEYVVDQPNDVDVGGPFGKRFEDAIDRLMLAIQSMYDKIQRAPKMPITGPVGADNFLVPEPDQLIGWNADGSALETKPQISQSVQEAIDAANAANDAADEAVAGAALSYAWANTAEDTDVTTPGTRSSYNWSRKSFGYANAAAASAASAAATVAPTIKAASPLLGANLQDADRWTVYDVSADAIVTLTTAEAILGIFNGTHVIPNGLFKGADFALLNTGNKKLTNDISALTADRVAKYPNADIDLTGLKLRAFAVIDQRSTQSIVANWNVNTITDDGVGGTIFSLLTAAPALLWPILALGRPNDTNSLAAIIRPHCRYNGSAYVNTTPTTSTFSISCGVQQVATVSDLDFVSVFAFTP